ncbi:MAG TPA: hypothetical protein VMY99_02550 [Nevskiaceae bacterium]|nr:hypothetical protein [Nevskiaceae bacterium]
MHKRIALLVLAAGVLCGLGASVAAQSVPQGYKSDTALQKGLIVRLKSGDGSTVEPLVQADAAEMLGVVVASNAAPVSLSSTENVQQVFVATTGQYSVLVSNQNGTIKSGDFVTISSLNGVGMKSTTTQTVVLGKALAGFDGKSGVETTAKVNDKQVSLGRVAVDITVAHNPLYSGNDVTGVPHVLSEAAGLVTTKPIGAVRIYASLAVLIVAIFIAGGVVYSGVRNGMVAIGRNPLAKQSIFRSLIQVTLMALIIFVIGLFAVYLLLRI